MTIWVGTSGYNYPEWQGSFYPPKLPATRMLPYYAEHFATVEINNTFYRAPTPKTLEGWSSVTPERFKLTLKAPQRITHKARLRDCILRLELPGVAVEISPAGIQRSQPGPVLRSLHPCASSHRRLLGADW